MLNNLKVRNKIFMVSLIMMILIFIVGIIGLVEIRKSNEEINSLYNNNLRAIQHLNDNRTQDRASEASVYSMILRVEKQDEQKTEYNNILKRDKTFDENLEKYRKINLDDYQKDKLATLEKDLKKYRGAREVVINLALQGKREEALEQWKQVQGIIANDFREKLTDLADYNEKLANNIKLKSDTDYELLSKLYISLLVIAMGLGVLFSIIVLRNITKPLNIAVKQLKLIADGNFSNKIGNRLIKRKDELGSILKGIDSMQSSLSILIDSVKNESYSIDQVVENINININELNGNIEQVSATIEEISAGMEETAASSEEMAASSQEIERSAYFIANKSEEGAVAARKISKRAEQKKLEFSYAMKKTDEIFMNSKIELENAMEE